MKKPRCYIENMERQYGEEWLVTVSPEIIQRNAKRIVRDMVKGFITYEKFGKYFLDAKFLENLIIACSNEYEIASVHYAATCMYAQMYPWIPNVGAILHNDYAEMYIYCIVLEKLNNVKITGNIAHLYDIGVLLFQYRNNIN